MNYYYKYKDGQRFGGNRFKAIERDGYKCTVCGMTDEDHRKLWNRGITVDHIDGNGRNSDFQNNEISNLTTLCLRCHGKKDILRRTQRPVVT